MPNDEPLRDEQPNRYFDPHFKVDTAKILPGEYYATNKDMALVTVLGSCVSACLRDRETGIGGMNHFMLPDEGKIVGSHGNVLQGFMLSNVGEQNAKFIVEYLGVERIPIVASDLLDVWPRKIYFFPR